MPCREMVETLRRIEAYNFDGIDQLELVLDSHPYTEKHACVCVCDTHSNVILCFTEFVKYQDM